jgi:hypothetical protein
VLLWINVNERRLRAGSTRPKRLEAQTMAFRQSVASTG